MVEGAKSHLESNPEMLAGVKQTLSAPGPGDPPPPETEPELCVSASCEGMVQQWPDAGALNAADLGMA